MIILGTVYLQEKANLFQQHDISDVSVRLKNDHNISSASSEAGSKIVIYDSRV